MKPFNAARTNPHGSVGFICLLLVLLTAMAPAFLARAGDAAPSEYQVKAVFLYHFTKFVEWPAGAGDKKSFVVGVVGRDPFGAELEKALDGKSVDGRPFVVRRFKQTGDVQFCNLLFVGDSELDRFPRLLGRLNEWNTLTVSDVDGFLQQGGAINFLIEGEKVRFEINPKAAERAGLKISSQLMKVAKAIRPDHR